MLQDYRHSWDGLPLSSTAVGSSEFAGSFAVGLLVAVGFVDSERELPWQMVASPPAGAKQLPAMVKLFPAAAVIVAAFAVVIVAAVVIAIAAAAAADVDADVVVAAAAGSCKYSPAST